MEVALSNTVFQVHVCRGVIVEIIRVEFGLCKESYTLNSWQPRQMRKIPGKQNNNYGVRTCFSTLRSGPEWRNYRLDVLLETNGLIRLAPPMRVPQPRALPLVFVSVCNKKDVVR